MSDILVSLIPYILGSAIVPVPIIFTILLLKNPAQGLLKAVAFLGGITTMRLLQGVLFGLVLDRPSGDAGEKGAVASTLMMVLGILLLINAVKKIRKQEDPDDPPPGWMTMIDNMTVFKAFQAGFGLLLISAKMWVFTLGALSTIGEAELGQPGGPLVFVLFVLLAQSLLLLPILIRILIPGQSMVILQGAADWLSRNNRVIMIAVSLVFGALFLYQGVSGLLK